MTFKTLIGSGSSGLVGIINTVIVPIIFACAFVVLVWGVVSYFFIHGSDEAKRAEGRKFILWGIIGMVILLSVWGFVNLVLSTLGIMPRS
jgi:Ca2+/Na+ antiporter